MAAVTIGYHPIVGCFESLHVLRLDGLVNRGESVLVEALPNVLIVGG